MTKRFDQETWRFDRFHAEEVDDPHELDLRSAAAGRGKQSVDALASLKFGKDYDRLLYSGAFRSLGGVTQVVSSGEVGSFHNRLTHSLKVAQTAGLICSHLERSSNHQQRDIINSFGGLHPSVVRSACLAHDIGHPPFGHIGEFTLQEIIEEPWKFVAEHFDLDNDLDLDSFEGNAQSFRIVTRLAFRESPAKHGEINPALNLTRATLAALSKYPWESSSARRMEKKNKWGSYSTEAELLRFAMQHIPTDREAEAFGQKVVESRSIEAQIMDWADDIAYAVHDAEDFFRAGLIPLDEIGAGGREAEDFIAYAVDKLQHKLPERMTQARVKDLLAGDDEVANGGGIDVFGILPAKRYDGSMESRIVLHGLASELIRAATTDLQVTEQGVLLPREDIFVIVEVLKKLTEYYVIDRPALGSAQRGQRQILIELVKALFDWSMEHFADVDDDDDDSSLARRRKEKLALPARLRDYFDIAVASAADEASLDSVVLRAVVDYVASLTDRQAIAYHSRICKGETGSMLEPWLFQ